MVFIYIFVKKQIMNELHLSKSLYLLQHKNNPVHWKMWGNAAFSEAKTRNLPILVSIGYSTCHWCHVMAHEVFENESVAKLMNQQLVCIKVDREEHPDVDEIYMEACTAINHSGGWPLNVFIDHNGRPFSAMTYVPIDSWKKVVNQIYNIWNNDFERIIDAAQNITQQLNDDQRLYSTFLKQDIQNQMFEQLRQLYDSEHPDFSGANSHPRFPAHTLFSYLLGLKEMPQDISLMLENVLEAIQDSGIHDRVGGGFHRYSTDYEWRVPHFEKMLYDNAQLVSVYAIAAHRFSRADFMKTSLNCANSFLFDDMYVDDSQTGFRGFASAIDADDPEGEGAYYAWTPPQLMSIYGNEHGKMLAEIWNVSSDDIFEHGVFPYRIPHPRGSKTFSELPPQQKNQMRMLEHEYIQTLKNTRSQRPSPAKDKKIITSWNALAINGLCTVYAHTKDEKLYANIREVADLLCCRFDGDTLYRLPEIKGSLSDYALSALGFFTLWQISENEDDLNFSLALVRLSLHKFANEDGAIFTSQEDSGLYLRYREKFDHAMPTGVSALLLVMVRLSHAGYLAEYKDFITKSLQVHTHLLQRSATHNATLLAAYTEWKNGGKTIDYPIGSRSLASHFQWVGTEIVYIPNLTEKNKINYCEHTSCMFPVNTWEELDKVLFFNYTT